MNHKAATDHPAPAVANDRQTQQFFEQVLGGLKDRSVYFSHKAIQSAANDAALSLKNSSLSVYLNPSSMTRSKTP